MIVKHYHDLKKKMI
jgi:dynein regulatory complex subunit 2